MKRKKDRGSQTNKTENEKEDCNNTGIGRYPDPKYLVTKRIVLQVLY